ncbi:MAG: peptidoglycan DD-metalloendopeptidase family protein [Ignavibacteriales bacterium]|nr:peptidoglycan DD-metalloendopeptidase family protein [Ignavibacteriales bacterium]
MVKKFLHIASISFLCAALFAQSKDSLQLKNQQLSTIKKEIFRLQSELKNKTTKEKESLRTLENINRQKLLLNKLINDLLAEEKNKEEQIQQTENEMTGVEDSIALLKEKYAKYVVWVYKNRGLSVLRFLLNTDSFNKTLKRYQYLQFISAQNKKTISQLVSAKIELNNLRTRFSVELSEKELLVGQKYVEQKNLSERENESKDLLSDLRKDQKMITAEIESKRRAEIEIKNIIARLVDEERERRAKLLEKKPGERKSVPSYNYANLENFSLLKGNLGWPVNRGKVVRKFGENKNVRLNTVTLNYGIDIQADKNEQVRAVAEGIVSAIDWVPGYGSIVIITHRDEFRTVYGHVSEITVKEGEKISGGKSIGRVNESLEGNILHFEIWNERNYQNPELWLAKK